MNRQRLTTRIAAEQSSEKKHNAGLKRDIEGFDYDTSKAVVLKRALHNINVSLGTLIAAMKELSILRGSEITPDGLLGGKGFIMPLKELKQRVNTAISDLSDVTDTLADELTNPKWGLSASEKKKVKKDNEIVEEEVDEIKEEATLDESLEDNKDKPEESPEEDPKEIPENKAEEKQAEEELIKPEDVSDYESDDTLEKYHKYINGDIKDKVASVLSKSIMANLTKGVK